MAIIRYRDENGNIVPLRAIKGEDGDQMFIRFSAYPDGTDMVEAWDDSRAYMGYAFGLTAPNDKSGYKWINLCVPFFGQHGIDGDHIFRVANGTAEKPSNAMTIDADGNMNVGGEVTFGEDNFSPREMADHLGNHINSVSDDLWNHMATSVKIASGNYRGNGAYGDGNPTTLTFDFAPMLLVVRCFNSYTSVETLTCVIHGTGGVAQRLVGGDPNISKNEVIEASGAWYSTTSDGKTVKLTAPSAKAQMNENGINYSYVAIGCGVLPAEGEDVG